MIHYFQHLFIIFLCVIRNFGILSYHSIEIEKKKRKKKSTKLLENFGEKLRKSLFLGKNELISENRPKENKKNKKKKKIIYYTFEK